MLWKICFWKVSIQYVNFSNLFSQTEIKSVYKAFNKALGNRNLSFIIRQVGSVSLFWGRPKHWERFHWFFTIRYSTQVYHEIGLSRANPATNKVIFQVIIIDRLSSDDFLNISINQQDMNRVIFRPIISCQFFHPYRLWEICQVSVHRLLGIEIRLFSIWKETFGVNCKHGLFFAQESASAQFLNAEHIFPKIPFFLIFANLRRVKLNPPILQHLIGIKI